MANLKNISSTESLLRIIRKDKAESPEVGVEESEPGSPKKPLKQHTKVLTKAWSSRKAVAVGVDLGYTHMKIIRVRQVSEKKWQLLDCENIPFKPDVPRGDPEFIRFLKNALDRFVGPSEKSRLWCLASSAKSDIRHMRIPKVSRKQLANAVYWTYKKESTFEEAENILDFEIIGNVFDQGVEKIAVTVYTAPESDVRQIEELFDKSGYPLAGISIGPFATQNLFRTGWVTMPESTVASLYVGRGWSRIDVFSSGNLVLARGIKAGMNSMMECILEDMNDRRDEITIELVDEGDEVVPVSRERDASLQQEDARRILLKLTPNPEPLSAEAPGYDLSEEECVQMILPAVERLARQVERSFVHHAQNIGPDRVQKLLVAGQYNIFNQRVLDYLEDQVGVPCQIFDPLGPDILFEGHALTPDSVVERASFSPALGMALSDNARTPNLLFPFKKKAQAGSIARINRVIFLSFLFLIAICTGVFLWQGTELHKREVRAAGLEQQLARYNPRVNNDLLLQLSAKLTGKYRRLKEYGRKYAGMAAISELSRITPPDIRLLNFVAEMGPVAEDEKKKGGKKGEVKKEPPKRITLEGVVVGKSDHSDDALADYLAKLKASKIFSDFSVEKTRTEKIRKRDVLHFWVYLDLVTEGMGAAVKMSDGG